MSLPLIAVCLWIVGASLMEMFPAADHNWRRAYVLVAIGVPLLGWVTYVHGPLIGLLVLAAGMSVLRWPLIYLGRWLRARVRG